MLDAYEVWFRGVHFDVGGGNGNVGLSSIALRWMLRKAKAAGLPIDEAVITSRDGKLDLQAKLCPATDLIPNEYRGFLKGERFHYTVEARSDHNNPSGEFVRETEQEEAHAVRLKDLPAKQAEPGGV